MRIECNEAWRKFAKSSRLRSCLGFKLDCKFITPEEFAKLPDKGTVDPQRFDRGNELSDFDFAIVDAGLFNKAIKANVGIANDGARTKKLGTEDLRKPGLETTAISTKQLVGNRPYSFVVYGSQKALENRGVLMWLSERKK